MYPPAVLWRCGAVECVVVHHWNAQSYEIKVTQLQRTVVHRWFDNDREAAEFASALAREYGAYHLSPDWSV